MASSMHFLKRYPFERMLRCFWLAAITLLGQVTYAQATIELSQFDIERTNDELSVSAQLQFELSSAVEEALLKGLPIYFKAEAEVVKERWYWSDKSLVASFATLQARISAVDPQVASQYRDRQWSQCRTRAGS